VIATSAKEKSQSLQFLQQQQQQLAAIQQQALGANSPWNAALAYRIPDSNINLSVMYQQGKNSDNSILSSVSRLEPFSLQAEAISRYLVSQMKLLRC
jgi:hypothetical protein